MSENLNVLCEAKREYLGQMSLIMTPAMIETFQELYNEAIKNAKGKQVLIMFQKLLKEVPNWSNATHQQHHRSVCVVFRLTGRCVRGVHQDSVRGTSQGG
jgi:uncharacterized NAD-dependent epimerase/dehydratase family protein